MSKHIHIQYIQCILVKQYITNLNCLIYYIIAKYKLSYRSTKCNYKPIFQYIMIKKKKEVEYKKSSTIVEIKPAWTSRT